MKNSLTRLLQQHRSRPFAASRLQTAQQPQQQAQGGILSNNSNAGNNSSTKSVSFATSAANQRKGPLSDELKTQIKAQLLAMIDNPDNVILSRSCYE